MKITNGQIILTNKEISKADAIIKKADTPELWQQFVSADDAVKGFVRYFALLPKERQKLMYDVIENERTVA